MQYVSTMLPVKEKYGHDKTTFACTHWATNSDGKLFFYHEIEYCSTHKSVGNCLLLCQHSEINPQMHWK